VEDYASVLLRSTGGVLGTVEVGNTVPRDATDGEWKIAGRDAILRLVDGTMRTVTAEGEANVPAVPAEPLSLTGLRDALDRWRGGAPPATSVHDSLAVAELIDQAYALSRA
jgi:predicted dehydrogenase